MAGINHSLLKLFLNKGNYDSYLPYINRKSLSKEEKLLIEEDYPSYYLDTSQDVIDLNDFISWFYQVRHRELSESQITSYNLLFTQIESAEVSTTTNLIVAQFNKERLKEEIIGCCVDGFDPDKIIKLVESCVFKPEELTLEKLVVAQTCEEIFIDPRLHGLKWRLRCLNESVGPCMPGKLGGVVAYVNTGKTTLLASEIAYMAKQLVDDEVILWFNNEQPDRDVQQRIWCAVLERRFEYILEHKEEADLAYINELGGKRLRIAVINCVGKSLSWIESIVKLYTPKLVIIDMLDNVSFYDKSGNESVRVYGLYQGFRHLAIKYNFSGLISSQADATATYQDAKTHQTKYVKKLGMGQMRQSKVDKQGQLDYMIGIGKDDLKPYSRYLSTPKNKCAIFENQIEDLYQEVKFDKYRSLYVDY